MGRHNERRLARQSINTELAEVMAFSEPGLPLGVVQGGIPGVDEHVKPPQKAGRAHPVGERYRSRTSHATPFRTVAFNDNAAGHGWTLPVPTPRPDFDKPVPAESSLTTVTVVLRITTASPTGDEECQHCHGQHADREPLTSFKVEAEDHSGERTGKQTGSDGVQQPSEFSPPRLRLSLTGARAPPQTDLANEHHEETDNPHTCRAEDERAGPLSEIDHWHGREHAQPQPAAKDRQELPRRFVLLAAALTRLTAG